MEKPIMIMDGGGVSAVIPWAMGPDGLSVTSSLSWKQIDAFRAGLPPVPSETPEEPAK